jgi:CYTH domain-containing protein
LRQQADPSRQAIVKKRRCFLYNDRYFQIDVYQQPMNGLVLLEGYLDYDQSADAEKSSTHLLPPWLQLKEVTDDKNWSMYTIAAKKSLN